MHTLISSESRASCLVHVRFRNSGESLEKILTSKANLRSLDNTPHNSQLPLRAWNLEAFTQAWPLNRARTLTKFTTICMLRAVKPSSEALRPLGCSAKSRSETLPVKAADACRSLLGSFLSQKGWLPRQQLSNESSPNLHAPHRHQP